MQPMVNNILSYPSASNDGKGKPAKPFSKLWVLDSGATDHVTCSTSYYTSYYLLVNIFVHLPNQQIIPATHKGTIYLNSNGSSLVLKDVLYVPKFSFNLVSWNKLSLHNSCIMVNDHAICVIQDLASKWKIGSAS